MNKVILIGHLGGDPELRYLEGGTAVATFSLATSKKWKSKSGETKTATQWHKCQVWGASAEAAGKYLKKGNQIAFEGELIYQTYETKEGVKKTISKIDGRFEFIGKKSSDSDNQTKEPQAASAKAPTCNKQENDELPADQETDDLPF